MEYHMFAFFLGFLLDLLLGDPAWLPHPVRLIGKGISWMERLLRGGPKRGEGETKRQEILRRGDDTPELQESPQQGDGRPEPQESLRRRDSRKELQKGIVLAVTVPAVTAAAAALLLCAAYRLHPVIGLLLEAWMTCQILATKCLRTESMKVYRCLQSGDLEAARRAVSMIVGRDTDGLDKEGVAKAAVETVAENTSDGVIAPMLYTALGGPALGFFYKAVNTMDSMVGYKNETYLYFGRAAARLDDLVNLLPSRCSAALMLLAACGGKEFDAGRAVRIYRRDRRKHASPNSAQTEAVCAGALGVRLGGNASYFGKIVEKPCIGDACRRVEPEDVRRANRLLYRTAWLGEIICLLLLAAVRALGAWR